VRSNIFDLIKDNTFLFLIPRIIIIKVNSLYINKFKIKKLA